MSALHVVSVTAAQVDAALDDYRLDRELAVRLLARQASELAAVRDEVTRLRALLDEMRQYGADAQDMKQSQEFRLLSASMLAQLSQRKVRP